MMFDLPQYAGLETSNCRTTPQDTLPSTKRLPQWDVLRSIAMFLVVVVHSAGYLGPIAGHRTDTLLVEFAFICDPVFFTLSGYFAIRPLRTSLKSYYFKKVLTILIPCFVYSVLLYLYTTGFQGMSLQGLIEFQYSQTSPWWFVPALIPNLLAAPFLYKLFESLSSRVCRTLEVLVAIMTAWGALSLFLTDVFGMLDMTSLQTLINLTASFLPTQIIPGSGYFIYFCLGYFIRRMCSSGMNTKNRNSLISAGIAAWALDTMLVTLGFTRFDPSYYWLFTTTALFLLTDRLHIKSDRARKLFSWTARHSFAIYLTQYTSIALIASYLYTGKSLEIITGLPAIGRIGAWLLLVAGAYLLSLLVAFLVDSTLVRGCQALVSGIAKACYKAARRYQALKS